MTVEVDVRHRGGARRGARLLRSARRFLGRLRVRQAELFVALVTDGEIRELNRRWRRKDEATDVLSFPAGEMPPGGPRSLGDIVISLDTARRVAPRRVDEELDRYLAHGLLHLLGYDHVRRGDAKKMAAAEAKLLGKEGMVVP